MYLKLHKNLHELQQWMLCGDCLREYHNGICMFKCVSRCDRQVGLERPETLTVSEDFWRPSRLLLTEMEKNNACENLNYLSADGSAEKCGTDKHPDVSEQCKCKDRILSNTILSKDIGYPCHLKSQIKLKNSDNYRHGEEVERLDTILLIYELLLCKLGK